ncbi:hypothetical protein chiPu_0026969, partial [Chiloscyllium punctatum]|nr:hypothetical protein [Chiloscyllium punctatum]
MDREAGCFPFPWHRFQADFGSGGESSRGSPAISPLKSSEGGIPIPVGGRGTLCRKASGVGA